MSNLLDPNVVFNFLRENSRLPQWINRRPYEEGVTGSYNPGTDRLTAFAPESGGSVNTVSHEMTHAIQNLMLRAADEIRRKQWQKEQVSPEELQFLRNYGKLMVMVPGTVGQFDRRQWQQDEKTHQSTVNALMRSVPGMPPENQNHLAYRTSPTEAQAFGVGNMTGVGPRDERYAAHLDPTMATTFSMMLDTFGKLPPAVKLAAARAKQVVAEESRKTQPLDDFDKRRTKDDYSSPFAPVNIQKLKSSR